MHPIHPASRRYSLIRLLLVLFLLSLITTALPAQAEENQEETADTATTIMLPLVINRSEASSNPPQADTQPDDSQEDDTREFALLTTPQQIKRVLRSLPDTANFLRGFPKYDLVANEQEAGSNVWDVRLYFNATHRLKIGTAVVNLTTRRVDEYDLDDRAKEKQQALTILLTVSEVTTFLADYPTWEADAYVDDEGERVWHVDFYTDTSHDEWIGNGHANLTAQTVIDYFVPRELTPEEYQHQSNLIRVYLDHDPEIQAILESPSLWYHELNYNRWDVAWEAYYEYGLDKFVALFKYNKDEDEVYLERIYDPTELETDKKEAERRDRAIQVAWNADGIGDALNGVDNWRNYVEHQQGNRYTVEFVGNGQTLFYALVDIESETVIESGR